MALNYLINTKLIEINGQMVQSIKIFCLISTTYSIVMALKYLVNTKLIEVGWQMVQSIQNFYL